MRGRRLPRPERLVLCRGVDVHEHARVVRLHEAGALQMSVHDDACPALQLRVQQLREERAGEHGRVAPASVVDRERDRRPARTGSCHQLRDRRRPHRGMVEREPDGVVHGVVEPREREPERGDGSGARGRGSRARARRPSGPPRRAGRRRGGSDEPHRLASAGTQGADHVLGERASVQAEQSPSGCPCGSMIRRPARCRPRPPCVPPTSSVRASGARERFVEPAPVLRGHPLEHGRRGEARSVGALELPQTVDHSSRVQVSANRRSPPRKGGNPVPMIMARSTSAAHRATPSSRMRAASLIIGSMQPPPELHLVGLRSGRPAGFGELQCRVDRLVDPAGLPLLVPVEAPAALPAQAVAAADTATSAGDGVEAGAERFVERRSGVPRNVDADLVDQPERTHGHAEVAWPPRRSARRCAPSPSRKPASFR